MNQVVFRPATPVSAVPVLPPTRNPGDLRGRAGSCLDGAHHHVRDVARVDGPHGAIEPLALGASTTVLPSARRSARRRTGASRSRVADPAGDHRHLQRRHEHPLLAERHAAGVDVGVRFGYQSSPFRYRPLGSAPRPASPAAAARRTRTSSPGSRIRFAPSAFPMLQKTELTECWSASRSESRPNGLLVSKLFTRLP